MKRTRVVSVEEGCRSYTLKLKDQPTKSFDRQGFGVNLRGTEYAAEFPDKHIGFLTQAELEAILEKVKERNKTLGHK